MMKQKPIKCPYCHANASLRPASVVYGLNRRSQGKFLYLCDRWPAFGGRPAAVCLASHSPPAQPAPPGQLRLHVVPQPAAQQQHRQ